MGSKIYIRQVGEKFYVDPKPSISKQSCTLSEDRIDRRFQKHGISYDSYEAALSRARSIKMARVEKIRARACSIVDWPRKEE